jgi:hypothetical protein
MDTESRTNADSTEIEASGVSNSTDSVFSTQDDDTRILLKWGAIITAIVVVTCFTTTSLLKVIGLVSASWLWVMAAAGVSSVITLIVLLLIAVFFVAAFINAIRGIG